MHKMAFLFSIALASSGHSMLGITKSVLISDSAILEGWLQLRGDGEEGVFKNTLLIEAVTKAQAETVRILLKYGADISFEGEGGKTAIIAASCLRDWETFQVVLEHNEALARNNIISNTQRLANINHKTNHGWTSLMYAAHWGRVEKVETLLRFGARINDKNEDYLTALMVANKERRRHIQELLDWRVSIYENDGVFANDLEREIIRLLDKVVVILRAHSRAKRLRV